MTGPRAPAATVRSEGKSRAAHREAQATTVTIVGSGDAFASGGRFQSGYVIDAGGAKILVEAAPTALSALKQASIRPADLDFVLISHLHGDHFAGLPFLILEYIYESPRRRNLVIAGPPQLEQRTWRLFRTMYPSTDASKVARRLKFIALRPNGSIALGPARVDALRVSHTTVGISLALRVAVGGMTIAFSGDTAWTEELVPFVAGADLFLCECTYFTPVAGARHLDYRLLAKRHNEFKVGRMILTHLGSEMIRRRGEIAIEMARDGMKVTLDPSCRDTPVS